jgi:hypothetical protein
MGTSPGWHNNNYWWGEGIGGGYNVFGSAWGMVPEGVFFYNIGDDYRWMHGQPATGGMTYSVNEFGDYDYSESKSGEFATSVDTMRRGPDSNYLDRNRATYGGGAKITMYPPSDANFVHGAYEAYERGNYKGTQRNYDLDYEMAEYNPRDLAPGEYAALYEQPGGNLGYETFDMGMSPSPYAPQGMKYTLPVPQTPELETGRGVEERAREIGEQWLRDRNQWSIPDATTGKYRERDDWDPVSSEEVRRRLATWDENTRKTWYVGFQKQALQEQAEQQRRYAKYQNELRYSQGLLLKEQAFGNIMSQIVGLGGQERRDIEKGFERKSAQELQSAMSRGMSSSTVLGSIGRGLQSEEAEAKGRLEDRLRREQAQTQALLVGDITSWIEGRVDEYPNSDQMANIMFGYGASGGGQQANAQGSAGSAMAGGALGCLLSKCCFLFRHARHRDGTEDWVIREYRDSMTTPEQKRGYYKMSEFLCPLMERHRLIRYAVKWLVCDPLVAYGKWFYRNHEYYADKKKGLGHRFGWVFAPIKKFWMKTWKHLGGEFEYIRSNGEVV